jgi:hypothetical protein
MRKYLITQHIVNGYSFGSFLEGKRDAKDKDLLHSVNWVKQTEENGMFQPDFK